MTGIMKTNVVASLPDHKARETSCYCKQCFSNVVFRVDLPCQWTMGDSFNMLQINLVIWLSGVILSDVQ